ncbi:unnamed protein product [Closterium sp. NIES-64]|nr:unnamed protein product [Closterium sp. NIES-64]
MRLVDDPLVPVRLDLEIGDQRLQDAFCWNSNACPVAHPPFPNRPVLPLFSVPPLLPHRFFLLSVLLVPSLPPVLGHLLLTSLPPSLPFTPSPRLPLTSPPPIAPPPFLDLRVPSPNSLPLWPPMLTQPDGEIAAFAEGLVRDTKLPPYFLPHITQAIQYGHGLPWPKHVSFPSRLQPPRVSSHPPFPPFHPFPSPPFPPPPSHHPFPLPPPFSCSPSPFPPSPSPLTPALLIPFTMQAQVAEFRSLHAQDLAAVLGASEENVHLVKDLAAVLGASEENVHLVKDLAAVLGASEENLHLVNDLAAVLAGREENVHLVWVAVTLREQLLEMLASKEPRSSKRVQVTHASPVHPPSRLSPLFPPLAPHQLARQMLASKETRSSKRPRRERGGNADPKTTAAAVPPGPPVGTTALAFKFVSAFLLFLSLSHTHPPLTPLLTTAAAVPPGPPVGTTALAFKFVSAFLLATLSLPLTPFQPKGHSSSCRSHPTRGHHDASLHAESRRAHQREKVGGECTLDAGHSSGLEGEGGVWLGKAGLENPPEDDGQIPGRPCKDWPAFEPQVELLQTAPGTSAAGNTAADPPWCIFPYLLPPFPCRPRKDWPAFEPQVELLETPTAGNPTGASVARNAAGNPADAYDTAIAALVSGDISADVATPGQVDEDTGAADVAGAGAFSADVDLDADDDTGAGDNVGNYDGVGGDVADRDVGDEDKYLGDESDDLGGVGEDEVYLSSYLPRRGPKHHF